VVIFTSVSGPPADGEFDPAFFKSTGPFTPGQDTLRQGNLRAPLLIRWPFWMKGPKASDVLCSAEDLVPTLLELVRIPVPEGMDGISLLPTVLGQPQTNRHAWLQWPATTSCAESAVRIGNWKVMQRGPGRAIEVYDLETDPGETFDLIGVPMALIRRIVQWPTEPASVTVKSSALGGTESH
jgi:arylsulfatase A-like enzyme